MGKIEILDGDFDERLGADFSFGFFSFIDPLGDIRETVPATQVREVVKADETAIREFSASAAAVGALALGPIGLLAGAAGRRVTFVATFADGRKLLGATDSGTFQALTRARIARPEAKKPRTGNPLYLWVLLGVAGVIILIASLL